MVNIIKEYIPKYTKARPCYSMFPLYITIHNTGNTDIGANAERHAYYKTVNGGQNKATSYHFVVDEEEVIQLIPCNEVSWHAGDGVDGTGNRKSISIEICENSDGDLHGATENAVELVRYLMGKYDIPIENVVPHEHWSGKNCPARLLAGEPYSWEEFLNRCSKEEKQEMTYYENLTDIPEGELRDNVEKLIQRGILRGTGNGLHISMDLVRTITILTRAGVL